MGSSELEPRDVGPAVGGHIRVADADRNRVVDVLNAAYADGRLTLDERDERVGHAMEAVVFDDLVPLTRDLVAIGEPPPRADPQAIVVDRLHANPASDQAVAVFSEHTRHDAWRVRRLTNAVAVFGEVVLDMRRATFESDVCEVNALVLFGEVRILVPEGVTVRSEAGAIFGETTTKGIVPGSGPTLVIKGLAGFGEVSVRAGEAALSFKERRALKRSRKESGR